MKGKSHFDKRKLIRNFFLKALVFYIMWQVLYLGFIRPNGQVDDVLTNLVVSGTTLGLELVGMEASKKENIVYVGSRAAVRVENQCNGLELLALFTGFIVCFPGKWKPKFFFCVLGCIFLFLTNIVREMVLALNYLYFTESFEINHKYTYAIIVYGIVFMIWKYWVKNYSVVSTRYD